MTNSLSTTHSGRYVSILPRRMINSYIDSLSDQELLAQKESLALIDARLSDLLGQVDMGVPLDTWNKLKIAYEYLKKAQATDDVKLARSAMADIDKYIMQGAKEQEVWAEIFQLIDLRRKVSESEQRRLVSMKQMFTAEQGTHLVRFIVGVILKRVKDPEVIRQIVDDINNHLSTNVNPNNVY